MAQIPDGNSLPWGIKGRDVYCQVYARPLPEVRNLKKVYSDLVSRRILPTKLELRASNKTKNLCLRWSSTLLGTIND